MILLGKAKNYVQNYRNACKPTQPTCTCTYILYIIDTCTLHTYCTLHTCIFHGWSNCSPCSQKSPADLLMLLVGSVCADSPDQWLGQLALLRPHLQGSVQVAPQVSPLLLRHHGQQGPHKLLGGATAPAQGNKYGFILHVHVHDQSVIETRQRKPTA